MIELAAAKFKKTISNLFHRNKGRKVDIINQKQHTDK